MRVVRYPVEERSQARQLAHDGLQTVPRGSWPILARGQVGPPGVQLRPLSLQAGIAGVPCRRGGRADQPADHGFLHAVGRPADLGEAQVDLAGLRGGAGEVGLAAAVYGAQQRVDLARAVAGGLYDVQHRGLEGGRRRPFAALHGVGALVIGVAAPGVALGRRTGHGGAAGTAYQAGQEEDVLQVGVRTRPVCGAEWRGGLRGVPLGAGQDRLVLAWVLLAAVADEAAIDRIAEHVPQRVPGKAELPADCDGGVAGGVPAEDLADDGRLVRVGYEDVLPLPGPAVAVGRQPDRPAAGLADRDHLGAGALTAHLALPLGEGQDDVQHGPAGRVRQVEVLADGDQTAAAVAQQGQEGDGVGEAAGQPVQVADDQDVPRRVAGLQLLDDPAVAWPAGRGAGLELVLDGLERGAGVAGQGVLPAGGNLVGDGGLAAAPGGAAGRDAGIDKVAHRVTRDVTSRRWRLR
ncbi:MAG: hypothetical protein BWZ02_03242 [Lentisphaerae bacterium ADurb.BinA184]|nr:MAG: hypothetical protein BWZ02_03242 [Lentisphaerae bacterium ADurb.BinA184]